MVGLLAFVGIFNFLLPDLGSNMDEGGLITLGIVFSMTPAVLWLVIFYRADAREPEPKRLVITVYIVGLLLAAALYQVVVVGFFDVDSWLYTYWWSQLFGEILVIGALSMGIVYLTVRFIVFGHPEFDERLDGIIYAIAAGLGIATVVNFAYVIQHGGVDLGIGSIRMVTNTLGYACFAGVLGYFMGQARFEQTPAYYLPVRRCHCSHAQWPLLFPPGSQRERAIGAEPLARPAAGGLHRCRDAGSRRLAHESLQRGDAAGGAPDGQWRRLGANATVRARRWQRTSDCSHNYTHRACSRPGFCTRRTRRTGACIMALWLQRFTKPSPTNAPPTQREILRNDLLVAGWCFLPSSWAWAFATRSTVPARAPSGGRNAQAGVPGALGPPER